MLTEIIIISGVLGIPLAIMAIGALFQNRVHDAMDNPREVIGEVERRIHQAVDPSLLERLEEQ